MTSISSRSITKRRDILENLLTFGRKKDSRDSMASCEEYYNHIKEPESPGQEKGEKPKSNHRSKVNTHLLSSHQRTYHLHCLHLQ